MTKNNSCIVRPLPSHGVFMQSFSLFMPVPAKSLIPCKPLRRLLHLPISPLALPAEANIKFLEHAHDTRRLDFNGLPPPVCAGWDASIWSCGLELGQPGADVVGRLLKVSVARQSLVGLRAAQTETGQAWEGNLLLSGADLQQPPPAPFPPQQPPPDGPPFSRSNFADMSRQKRPDLGSAWH